MLSCRDISQHASALLEQELSMRQRIAVRMHLLLCRHCRRFINQLACLTAALRARGSADTAIVPAACIDRIMNALPPAQLPGTD